MCCQRRDFAQEGAWEFNREVLHKADQAAGFSSAEIHTKLESKEKQDGCNWIRSGMRLTTCCRSRRKKVLKKDKVRLIMVLNKVLLIAEEQEGIGRKSAHTEGKLFQSYSILFHHMIKLAYICCRPVCMCVYKKVYWLIHR